MCCICPKHTTLYPGHKGILFLQFYFSALQTGYTFLNIFIQYNRDHQLMAGVPEQA
jgi:hypothetical protein